MLNNSWLKAITSDGDLVITDEGPSLIANVDIETLIKSSLSSANLAENMCRIIDHLQIFSYHMMAFMSKLPSLYFRGSHSEENEKQHSERLSNILEACSMQRHPIAGDGDCCFSAVAFSLNNNSDKFSASDLEFLQSLGILFSMDNNTMAMQLRKILVREWKEEAPKFLTGGYFHGDLGDLMLTGLSNSLRVSIIVFTSTAYHPFLCISPQCQEEKVKVPLMVAFSQYGPGHYDGVVPKPTIPESVGNIKCSCGKNDTNDANHCCEIKHKYTSTCRCPCKRNGRGCTSECRCKNCMNPLGQRPLTDIPKRKRFKHDWQQHRSMRSIDLAELKQEKIVSGPFTKVEFFLLENILSYCVDNDIEVMCENIHLIYMQVMSAVKNEIPLCPRNVNDIEQFLEIHQKIVTNFKLLCKMQLEWNLSMEE